ncbi:hypothetical protein DB30_04629 [Enhygromyxa salina]|uniref:Uncharacterized protein n=1 Tax=Enhygromyxa salina TaxID=215803 RepID=A0A0C1ZNW0_9BACT|nr:hypothetical protein [Enhygromyxa salina]KIG19164.1 hypothetical protein DB30_04629 [Enhygromyxa salina]
MSRLVFHSMYPDMKLPVSGEQVLGPTTLPKRARSFCKPMTDEVRSGVYLHAPIEFEFRHNRQTMWLRTTVGDLRHTAIRHFGVTARADLLVSDLFPERSRELQARFRAIARGAEFPDDLTDDPSYRINDRLLSAISEPDAPGGMVIVWLGGTLYTEGDDKLLIKGVPNLYQRNRYEVLDAIIESSRWHGWVGAVIRSYEQDTWVPVSSTEPFTKAMILGPRTELEIVPFDQRQREVLVDPLRWSDFDATYARPPGKYLRDLRHGGSWDTEWKSKLDLRPPARLPSPQLGAPSTRIADATELSFFETRLRLVEDLRATDRAIEIHHNGRVARFGGADACEVVDELCARPRLSAAELATRTPFEIGELRGFLQRLVETSVLNPVA